MADQKFEWRAFEFRRHTATARLVGSLPALLYVKPDTPEYLLLCVQRAPSAGQSTLDV